MKKYMVLFMVIALIVSGCGINQNTSEKEMPKETVQTTMESEEADLKQDKTITEDDQENRIDDKAMLTEEEKVNQGDFAPDFALESLDGEKVKLQDLKGQKVLVKFWASWCSICLSGLKELDTLSSEDNDFVVYTIVSPGQYNEKEKKAFIEWFNTLGHKNIKVLFDETGEVMQYYGVRAFPTLAYIGSDNVLVGVIAGHVSNDMIKEHFEKVK